MSTKTSNNSIIRWILRRFGGKIFSTSTYGTPTRLPRSRSKRTRGTTSAPTDGLLDTMTFKPRQFLAPGSYLANNQKRGYRRHSSDSSSGTEYELSSWRRRSISAEPSVWSDSVLDYSAAGPRTAGTGPFSGVQIDVEVEIDIDVSSMTAIGSGADEDASLRPHHSAPSPSSSPPSVYSTAIGSGVYESSASSSATIAGDVSETRGRYNRFTHSSYGAGSTLPNGYEEFHVTNPDLQLEDEADTEVFNILNNWNDWNVWDQLTRPSSPSPSQSHNHEGRMCDSPEPMTPTPRSCLELPNRAGESGSGEHTEEGCIESLSDGLLLPIPSPHHWLRYVFLLLSDVWD